MRLPDPDGDSSIFQVLFVAPWESARRRTGIEVLKDLSLFSDISIKQGVPASEICQEAPCNTFDVSPQVGTPGRSQASCGPLEEQTFASEFVSRGWRTSPLAHRGRHASRRRAHRVRAGHGAAHALHAAEALVAALCASRIQSTNEGACHGESHVA